MISAVRAAEIVALVMCGLAMFLMAKEDIKDSEVSENLCFLGWLTTLVAMVIVRPPLGVLCLVLVLFIVFICNFEAALFGDADYIPVAMFLAFYGRLWRTPFLWMIPLVCLLCVLIPYGKWWGKYHGDGWYLGCKKMVPALPLYFCTWCLSGVCYMAYSFAVDAGCVDIILNYVYTRW